MRCDASITCARRNVHPRAPDPDEPTPLVEAAAYACALVPGHELHLALVVEQSATSRREDPQPEPVQLRVEVQRRGRVLERQVRKRYAVSPFTNAL